MIDISKIVQIKCGDPSFVHTSRLFGHAIPPIFLQDHAATVAEDARHTFDLLMMLTDFMPLVQAHYRLLATRKQEHSARCYQRSRVGMGIEE